MPQSFPVLSLFLPACTQLVQTILPGGGTLNNPPTGRMTFFARRHLAWVSPLVGNMREVAARQGLLTAFRIIVAFVFTQVLWVLACRTRTFHHAAIQHSGVRFHVRGVRGSDLRAHRPADAADCPTCHGRSGWVQCLHRSRGPERFCYPRLAKSTEYRAIRRSGAAAIARFSETHPSPPTLESAGDRCCPIRIRSKPSSTGSPYAKHTECNSVRCGRARWVVQPFRRVSPGATAAE